MDRLLMVFVLSSIGLGANAETQVSRLVGTKYAGDLDGYLTVASYAFNLHRPYSGPRTIWGFDIFQNLKSKKNVWIVSRTDQLERTNVKIISQITFAMDQPIMMRGEGVAIGECSKNGEKLEYVVAIVKYHHNQEVSSDVRSAWWVDEKDGTMKPYPTKGLTCSVPELVPVDSSVVPVDN